MEILDGGAIIPKGMPSYTDFVLGVEPFWARPPVTSSTRFFTRFDSDGQG